MAIMFSHPSFEFFKLEIQGEVLNRVIGNSEVFQLSAPTCCHLPDTVGFADHKINVPLTCWSRYMLNSKDMVV
jgi:hypothetical protein